MTSFCISDEVRFEMFRHKIGNLCIHEKLNSQTNEKLPSQPDRFPLSYPSCVHQMTPSNMYRISERCTKYFQETVQLILRPFSCLILNLNYSTLFYNQIITFNSNRSKCHITEVNILIFVKF